MNKKDIIWIKNFGNKKSGEDPFSRKVNYYEYNTQSEQSWTIDHIWPLSLNGSNDAANCQILAYSSNEEKKNLLQGNINYTTFAVKKIETVGNGKIIGRTKVRIDNEWYWAYDE